MVAKTSKQFYDFKCLINDVYIYIPRVLIKHLKTMILIYAVAVCISCLSGNIVKCV